MIIDRLLVYGLSAALAGALAFGGYAWFVHGHARYVAGIADEQARWTSVIRETNAKIEELTEEANESKRARDSAVATQVRVVTETKFVEIPVAVARQCDMPQSVRNTLNSINVRGTT